MPVNRTVSRRAHRPIGIVRTIGTAAEQVEGVSQHALRRVDRGPSPIRLFFGGAPQPGLVHVDVQRVLRQPFRNPVSLVDAGLAQLVGPLLRRRNDRRRRRWTKARQQSTEHQDVASSR
jgi:hypothetical protein